VNDEGILAPIVCQDQMAKYRKSIGEQQQQQQQQYKQQPNPNAINTQQSVNPHFLFMNFVSSFNLVFHISIFQSHVLVFYRFEP